MVSKKSLTKVQRNNITANRNPTPYNSEYVGIYVLCACNFFSSSFSVLRMLIYRFIVVTCMWGVSFLVTFCYFYRLDLARFACISIYISVYMCVIVIVCVCFFPAPQSQFALKECINISVQRFSFRFKIPCDPFNSLFFLVRCWFYSKITCTSLTMATIMKRNRFLLLLLKHQNIQMVLYL